MGVFQISAFTDEFSPSIDKQISWLLENNLEMMEIRGVDGTGVADISDRKANEVAAKLKSNGIKISAIGSPVGKINIKDDFTPHFEKFRRVCEIADILSAERIRIFSFYIDNNEPPEHYREEVLSRLCQLADYAKSEKLLLCHENEKGIYGNTAERCLDIVTNVDGIKCVFDPANFVADGNQDCVRAYELLKDYIEYYHIKDSDISGNMVVAGKGEGKIKDILSFVKCDSRETILTLEPHLMEFSGLSGLERDGERSGIECLYSNNSEAFAAAKNALLNILEEI